MHARLIFSTGIHPIDSTFQTHNYVESNENHAEQDAFHRAAQQNDVDTMARLYALDKTVLNRFHSYHRTTPLCWAIESHADQAVCFLLSVEADIFLTERDFSFYFPLWFLGYTNAEENATLQADTRKALFQYTADVIIKIMSGPELRSSNASLLNALFHQFVFMASHDYFTLDNVRENLQQLESFFVNRSPSMHLSQQLAEHSLYKDAIEVKQISGDDPEPILLAQEKVLAASIDKLSSANPMINDPDLACEIFLFANQDSMSSLSSVNHSQLYEFAVSCCDDDFLFMGIIFVKKSLYSLHRDLPYHSYIVDATEDAEKAYAILETANTRNMAISDCVYDLLIPLFMYYESYDNDITLINNLASLAYSHDSDEFTIRLKTILMLFIAAHNEIIINDTDAALITLNTIIDEQSNDTECHDLFEALPKELLDKFFSETINHSILQLTLVAVYNHPVRFNMHLNALKKLISILDFYLDDKLVVSSMMTMRQFFKIVLTNHAVKTSQPKLILGFLTDIMAQTNSLQLFFLLPVVIELNNLTNRPQQTIIACQHFLSQALVANNLNDFLSVIPILATQLTQQNRYIEAKCIHALEKHYPAIMSMEKIKLDGFFTSINSIKAQPALRWIADIYLDFVLAIIDQKLSVANERINARLSTILISHARALEEYLKQSLTVIKPATTQNPNYLFATKKVKKNGGALTPNIPRHPTTPRI